MDFDAVVLAGGRGSRLGGVAKALLQQGGMSLLSLALHATAGARNVVVVGDVEPTHGYRVARENPPYAGPVAAIAAGLAELAPESSPFTLILACDIPDSASAVQFLLESAANLARVDSATTTGIDAVIAIDEDDREQYLLAIYSTGVLARRLASIIVNDSSMRQLTHGMNLERVLVPAGSTADVDTWADAATLGVTR
jgi:molybdopterin-guanine dinucleotide biosynthesis protein A